MSSLISRIWQTISSSASTIIDMDLMPTTNTPRHAASDIYRAAVLLTRLPLPADLIPIILDYAEYTYVLPSIECSDVFRVGEPLSGRIYIAARLPRQAVTSLRAIRFTTESKDQGYSWDTRNHGTYGGSWTWFEAGTLEDDQFNGEFNFLPSTRVVGRRIATNIHAGRDYKRHEAVWRVTDNDNFVQEAFAAVKKGKPVAIAVCARFPAWVNEIKYGAIQFEVQPVRKV